MEDGGWSDEGRRVLMEGWAPACWTYVCMCSTQRDAAIYVCIHLCI